MFEQSYFKIGYIYSNMLNTLKNVTESCFLIMRIGTLFPRAFSDISIEMSGGEN